MKNLRNKIWSDWFNELGHIKYDNPLEGKLITILCPLELRENPFDEKK